MPVEMLKVNKVTGIHPDVTQMHVSTFRANHPTPVERFHSKLQM